MATPPLLRSLLRLRVVIPVGLVAGIIFEWSSAFGWGAPQWTALGTWFTGLATLAAVTVALWQSHTAGVRSRSLLQRELDSQHRAQQVQALLPIWDRIGVLIAPFPLVNQALEELRRRYGGSALWVEYADTVNTWLSDLALAEAAIHRARMVVFDSETSDHLEVMSRRCREIAQAVAVCRELEEMPYDAAEFKHLEREVKGLQAERDRLGEIARRNLARPQNQHPVQTPPARKNPENKQRGPGRVGKS